MQNLWKSLHGVKQIKKKLYWKTKFSENHHCIAYVAQQALHELQLQNKYGPFLSYFKIDFNFNLTVENQQSKKIKERTGEYYDLVIMWRRWNFDFPWILLKYFTLFLCDIKFLDQMFQRSYKCCLYCPMFYGDLWSS